MNLTYGNCSIIPVPPNTDEFNHCMNRFTGDYYMDIEGLYKVYNPSSDMRFNLRLEQYKTKDSYCIRSLFHDTSEENAVSICTNNFDWRYGRRYKYGPGVYFSISPTLANRHSSRGPYLQRSMFIVNVLMSNVLTVPEGAEVSLPDLYYDEDYDTILCHGGQTYLKFFDCEYYPIYFINYISKWMGATVFVQPLDLIKNRMQLSKGKEYPTSLHAARGIIAKEGFFGLYNGLSAGLFRQATYTTARLGIYTFLFDKAKSSDGKPPGFAVKAIIGMISGMCGAFVGTPAEVALIRMTADGRLPPAERRNYSNVFNALSRIVKEEGVLTLWRGAVPTMGRAMVVNAAQLASYSQAKQLLVENLKLSEGIFLHFVASMISGLITTAASMPVDIAKTRIQNMKTIDGKPEFKGPLDVLGKVIRNEGVFALWKGFMPYYFRLGPHTVLTFIFLEQMNAAYFKHVLGEEKQGGL
nr:unnamed protein product [Callosobruchus chinensis]